MNCMALAWKSNAYLPWEIFTPLLFWVSSNYIRYLSIFAFIAQKSNSQLILGTLKSQPWNFPCVENDGVWRWFLKVANSEYLVCSQAPLHHIPDISVYQVSLPRLITRSLWCTHCPAETSHPIHGVIQTSSEYNRLPLNGLNLFSRSNSCLPSRDRSIRRSGHMAYSSIVLLIW